MSKLRDAAVLLPALMTVLTLAACGGTAASAPPPAASPAPGVAGSSAPGGASSSDAVQAGQGPIAVCQVVTAADVAPLFVKTVVATVEPSLVGEASGCSYRAPDSGHEPLSIEVVAGDQAAAYYAGNIAPAGEKTVALSGIGDKAMRKPGYADFVSIKGTVFCEIEAGSSNSDQYVGLASPDASGNLPDESATAFAQKLGALCNKVFAGQ